MSSSSNKRDEQVHRDEHNDVALAKRTLSVGYDYDKGEYAVAGIMTDGRVPVLTDPLLLENIEKQSRLLSILIKHLECLTDEVFTEEDIKDDYI
jgi:hypothetical protein